MVKQMGNRDGQRYFFQQNARGSVIFLTGFAGGVIESYRSDAFGSFMSWTHPATAAWTDKGKWPTIIIAIPVLAPFFAPESPALVIPALWRGDSAIWSGIRRWGPIAAAIRQMANDPFEDPSTALPDEPVPLEQIEPTSGRQFNPRNPAFPTPPPRF